MSLVSLQGSAVCSHQLVNNVTACCATTGFTLQASHSYVSTNWNSYYAGRKESTDPCPRCCLAESCTQQDRGRYTVLTTLRTDKYLPLLQVSPCVPDSAGVQPLLTIVLQLGHLLQHDSTCRDLDTHVAKSNCPALSTTHLAPTLQVLAMGHPASN